MCHFSAYPLGISPPPRRAERILVWPHPCAHDLWAPPNPMSVLWSQACLHQPILGSWAGSASPTKSQLDDSYFLTVNFSQRSLLACQHAHAHFLVVMVLLKEKQCSEAVKWHRINNWVNFHFPLYPSNKVPSKFGFHCLITKWSAWESIWKASPQGDEMCFSKPGVTVMAISIKIPIVQEPCCRAQRARLPVSGLLGVYLLLQQAHKRTSWEANVCCPHESEWRSQFSLWLTGNAKLFLKWDKALWRKRLRVSFVWTDCFSFLCQTLYTHTHTHPSPLIFIRAQWSKRECSHLEKRELDPERQVTLCSWEAGKQQSSNWISGWPDHEAPASSPHPLAPSQNYAEGQAGGL